MAIGILAAVLGLLLATAAIVIPRIVTRHNNPEDDTASRAYLASTGRSAEEVEQANRGRQAPLDGRPRAGSLRALTVVERDHLDLRAWYQLPAAVPGTEPLPASGGLVCLVARGRDRGGAPPGRRPGRCTRRSRCPPTDAYAYAYMSISLACPRRETVSYDLSHG
jgi:hypothetical protein